MAIGSTPGGSGHVVPDDPDHPLVVPEDTVAMARMEDARFREVGTKVGELLARVNDIAVASGVASGSPDDGKVAAFVRDSASRTRGALTELVGALLEAAIAPVRDYGPVHVSRFGAKGDGAADDTAALVAAGASGREVHFSTGGVYNFRGPVTISEGTRWVTNGARLYCTTPRNNYNIVLQSDTFVDVLDASFAGGNDDRGVLVEGSYVEVGRMRLVARTASTARNYRRRGLVIGAEGVGCQHVRLGDVRVEGFLDSVGSWNGTDVTVDRLTMRGHVQGLYLANPTRWTVRAGSADKINLGVASGGPGENSVLVETDGRVDAGEVSFTNFHSRESGEHGFRVGGQSPITGITFDNCKASRSGAGNGTGGCGFKALGPTSILSNARSAKHRNIRFINCTVEPAAVVKGGSNFAAFNIGKCEGVSFVSPVVTRGTAGSGDTAAYGIAMIGCENVSISEPAIEYTTSSGIRVYDAEDSADATWGGDPSALSISGGFIRGCGRGLEVTAGNRVVRRLTTSNLTVDGGDYGAVVWGGTMNRCSLDMNINSPTAASLRGTEAVMCRVEGDLVGASPARNGSTFTDYQTGDFLVRRSDAWVRVPA